MLNTDETPRPRAVTQYVGTRMSAEQILALDTVAAQEGIDRAGVVDRALHAYMLEAGYEDAAPPGRAPRASPPLRGPSGSDQQLIGQAVVILMREGACTHREADDALRAMAGAHRVPTVDVATAIVDLDRMRDAPAGRRRAEPSRSERPTL